MSILTGNCSLLHCNMASLTASSINISLTQAFAFKTNKSNISCNVKKQTLSAQKHKLTSIRLFPHFHIGCVVKPNPRNLTAHVSDTNVVVEEADLSSTDTVASVSAMDGPEISSVKSTSSRLARKSEMPPVTNEELIPGTTFTGKVRSIQPFGAFVDFGAFTDGLVHVSQLSDRYVKDVSNVVTVGEEVTVRLVEANVKTGRIALSMRADNSSKAQQQKSRDETKKLSKFGKGQDLEGSVKNLTRAGAFICLPEGEEGFLPTSEEIDEGFGNMMGGSSLEVGQQVSVRVLRISRGQVTLTMKKGEAGGELDAKLSQGVLHTATNPFLLAFRSNQDIAAFLDQRENDTDTSNLP